MYRKGLKKGDSRRRALVETRKGILSKTKRALRPMTILASLTRRQESPINVPLRGAALDPAPARSAGGLPELYERRS
jgi:hypothetical protein